MRQLHVLALAAMGLAACSAPGAPDEPVTALASVNGGQIEYVVTGPDDGEPLLLVHGAALGAALALIQDQPALAEYRVIRMHRRGFIGSSDQVGPMSVADHAADAIGLLDALGIERAHVAGHSIGGAMVLEMAAAAPERLETLILLDPAPASGLGLVDPVAEALKPGGPFDPARPPADSESAIAAFMSFAGGENWREYVDALPGGFAQAVADYPREIRGAPFWTFSRAQIEAVETPTLVVWGAESFFVDHSKALAEALPDAEGREIADANHALVQQVPDQIAEVIAEFLLRHSIRASPAPAAERAPVIDMHLHAARIDAGPPTAVCTPLDPPAPLWDQRRPFAEVYAEMVQSPACEDPVWSRESDEALTRETIAAMERANVVGVLGGVDAARSAVIDDWLAAAPERFIPGAPCLPTLPDCTVDDLRELHTAGKLDVLAELYMHYLGMAPDDERLEPYWTLAEELDIPVGIHIGAGIPPGLAYLAPPEAAVRARLHSPLALEDGARAPSAGSEST